MSGINPILKLEDVTSDIDSNLKEIQKTNEHDYQYLFQDRITDKSNIKPIEPIITVGGSNFASRGDFSVIGGLPKAGKTSVVPFILASAFMKDSDGMDTLSIQTKYCNNNEVFYFDTEQPPPFTDKLRKQVLKLIGTTQEPPNLYIINLRQYSYTEKKKRIFEWMEVYPQAHLWIIDGIADLIRDPNDTKESFGVIEELYTKSSQLNTTIVGFIHENPGSSGKLRGNLGSEAERKCGGAINIKKHKEEQCHSIEARLIRGGPDFDPIYFRYDSIKQRHCSVTTEESTAIRFTRDKSQQKQTKLVALAKRTLLVDRLTYSDLSNSIVRVATEIEGKPIAVRTAQNRIKSMIDAGIILLENELYALTDKYKAQP